MRNHGTLSRSESKQASDASLAFVRPRERRNKHDDDPLRAALDALVERAGMVELREGVEAERLRADAQVLLAPLVAAGRLPAYNMTVASNDPLVVVIHMLAVVARRLNEADGTVHE